MKINKFSGKCLTLGILIAISFTFGCVSKVVVSEVLQMQIDDKLYTKYNIWFTNPDNVNCLNIQVGKILPIGTEVEIVECNEEKVRFIDVNTKQTYTIIFNRGERMETMREYVTQTFTTKPLDVLLSGISPETIELIQKGEITIGMTKDEIELSYGPVPSIHTPDKRNITWMYPIEHNKYIRLRFRGNKLKGILNLYEDEKK